MISIIVCSANTELLASLKLNVDTTIGISYEFLAYDNRLLRKGIAEVYNKLASEAAYDILCFVHEDVRFHTKNWGDFIKNLLSDPLIALVGVSGTVYKTAIPGSWVDCDKRHYRVNTLQHHYKSDKVENLNLNPNAEEFSVVSVIDGVFMATRKSIWDNNIFDEKLLKGFHGYDLDISLRAGKFGKVVVTHKVLLEHFSSGTFSYDWLKDILLVHEKWKDVLPRNAISPEIIDDLSEYIANRSLLSHLLKYRGNEELVSYYYRKMFSKYFLRNGLRFSKTVAKYLFYPNV